MAVEESKGMEHKPDHPMADLDRAESLLAELPTDNAFEALEKITGWLTSVTTTPDFRPDNRLAIIQLLNETGQLFSIEVQRQYLAASRLQSSQDKWLWQAALDFSQRGAEAYTACLNEMRQHDGNVLPPEQLALVCTRAMRAYAIQLKLLLMRYLPVERRIWDGLFGLYSMAQAVGAATTQVHTFQNEARQSSPQQELLRALMLEVASPESLTPDQLELASRVASRFADEFDFLRQPNEDCGYYINLAQPQPPEYMNKEMTVNASFRFLGAGLVKSKLEQIIKQNELGTVEHEARFGEDYTADQKLTMLKHLPVFWGPNPPRRRQDREGVSVDIDIVHGYNVVSKLITQVDFSCTPRLTAETTAKLKEQSRADSVGTEFSAGRGPPRMSAPKA